MKTLITLFASFLIVSSAEAAAYIKFDGVQGETVQRQSSSATSATATTPVLMEIDDIKGESTDDNRASSSKTSSLNLKPIEKGTPVPGVEPDEIDVMQEQEGVEPDEIDVMEEEDPQESPAFIKIDDIDGESKETSSKPASQASREVERTIQTAPLKGVEPDEIDVAADPEPNATNFGVLLGGGDGGEDSDDEEGRAAMEEMLLKGAQEAGQPVEQISLNYEKAKVKVKRSVKLFGFIPVSTTATVEIDAEEHVEVKYPWWAFLATGKQKDEVGQSIFDTLSDILTTQSR